MTDTLILPATVVTNLKDALLQEDELERFAFVRCNPSTDRHLAATVNLAADDDMEQQGLAECRPALEREREVAHSCYEQGQGLFMVHSHPFADRASFSDFDRRIMQKMSRWLDGLYGDDLDIFFGVLAQEELVVTRFNVDEDTYEPLDLQLVGPWTYDAPMPRRDPKAWVEYRETAGPAVTSEKRVKRFDRLVRALTETAPEELHDTRVALVGAGGLGSVLAEQLTRLGVGHLDIIDPDVVEPSNLPRLYGAYEEDVGEPKVSVIADHCRAIDSSISVGTHEAIAEDMTEVLAESDIVLAGLDRMSSRAFLNEFCVKHCLPYIDSGVVITTDEGTVESMEGYVQTVAPGATACLACLNRIDRERARIERLPEDEREQELERGYIAESDLAPEPAVVHLNTTIAGMAVSELVNLVTGVDSPSGLIRFEALDNSLLSMGTTTARGDSCPVCGTNGVLALGTADHTVVEIDSEELDLSFENTSEGEIDVTETDRGDVDTGDGDSQTTTQSVDSETVDVPQPSEDGDVGTKQAPAQEQNQHSSENDMDLSRYLPVPRYGCTVGKEVLPWNR